MGQQGMASAASVHVSYGQSMICNCRTKAKINAEFPARNKLEMDNAKAQHNRQIYQRYTDEHKLRRKERLSIYWRGQALSRGHRCYALTKNQLEVAKRGPDKVVPTHSCDGDSTDYDTEADEKLHQMLAEMPPLTTLPLAPSLPQPPATGSEAGQQIPLPPPPPPPALPTSSGTGQAPLLRKAIHTPPASEVEQAVRPRQPVSPSVQSFMDTHASWQKEDEDKKQKAAEKKKRTEEKRDRQ